MNLLRNEKFQELLVNYERAKGTFIVAVENVDEVKSERVIRAGGKIFTPQDYITAFSLFIQQNRDKVDAIKILLERPKDWSTAALEDLRKTLRENNYPEPTLQNAHAMVHKVALPDIISMIKHAVKEQEPILTAQERVWRAMETITQGKKFTEEQSTWLGYIAQHLTENLTVDADDIENLPVFTRHGGLGKAKQVFNQGLEPLLREINLAVAA
jgi:type I restriction enzyme R subunit